MPPSDISESSQRFSPFSKRRSASAQIARVSASPAGMKLKYTLTAPPQIMPRFSTSARVSEKSFSPETLSRSTSAARCSERYSTAPPPIVPRMRPSLPMSILAPAPLGVAPDEATTVTSTRSSPAARRADISLNISLISLFPFRKSGLFYGRRPAPPHISFRALQAPPACRSLTGSPQSAPRASRAYRRKRACRQ